MDPIHQTLRWIHIIVGTIGLVLFWFPVLTRKGGRVHRAVGSWFIRCALIVSVTAVVSCIWAWLSPATFLNRQTIDPATSMQLRFFFGILGILALVSLQGAQFGAAALRLRDDPKAFSALPILSGLVGQAAFSAAMLIWCGRLLASSRFQSPNVILVILGILALLDAGQQYGYLRAPTSKPSMQIHIESLLGCGIAFHTAALVTIINRFTNLNLTGPLAMIPWLLPTIIGVPAIVMAVRRHSRQQPKAGEAEIQN